MSARHLKAHFDGKQIVLDEAFELLPTHSITVTVADSQSEAKADVVDASDPRFATLLKMMSPRLVHPEQAVDFKATIVTGRKK